MIVCNKCGKENQDHYKFCLGCGSELVQLPPPPEPPVQPGGPYRATPPQPSVRKTSGQSAPVRDAVRGGLDVPLAVSPTPPAGIPQARTTDPEYDTDLPRGGTDPAGAALAARSPSAGMLACPSCATPNPKEFIFCGNCGARMQAAAPPRTMHAGRGVSAAAAEPTARTMGKLGLIRPDGTEGGAHMLTDALSVIGRGSGPLFDHDSYLSPRHARFSFDGGRLILDDAGSLNGVFMKISQEEPLQSGDVFRIGQELVRFDAILEPQLLEDGTEIMGSPNPGYWGRLSVIMGPGIDGSAFPLMGEEMVLGRERGDILFSDDGYVSGIHAKLSVREDGYFLTDLGSSNGTFIRLTQPRVIPSGTFILMGQQLFRLEF